MAENITTTINQPPEFLRNYYAALAERGSQLGNTAFTPYTQNRIAPWTNQQNMAAGMIQNRALQGSGAMNQAANWFSNLLNGGFNVGNVNTAVGPQSIAPSGQIGNIANPGTIGKVNPTLGPNSINSGGTSYAGWNPYAGMDNPYLNNAIKQAMGDVESRINSTFNGNAFGGTAHQQTLARELGNVSNNMRMQDYSTQQGLAENAVNRDLSNQQYNINNANSLNQFNAGLGFQNANIANQMGQVNAGIEGQNVNNQQAANQFNAGLQGQNIANTNAINQYNAGLGWNAANAYNQMGQFNAGIQQGNVGRMQSGLGYAPTLAANDYADANALMGVGNQLFGYNQSIADANYQEFMRQQQYPTQQLQWMQAGINPSQSAFGTSTTQTPTPQSSPIAGAIGGGLAGYAGLTGLNNIFNTGLPNWAGALGGGLLGAFL